MARQYRSLKEALETGRGIERPFNCPDHDDTNASASVNVDKGVYWCAVCLKGGKTQDGTHDMKYISRMADAPIPEMSRFLIAFHNAMGPSPYWAGRYGGQVARAFDTGTDPITGHASIPITAANGYTLHGFLLRNDNPDEGSPKYLYPTAVPVSRLLFAHHTVPASPEVLVLVEGAGDVMALHQWALPAGTAVCAVYGAGLHVAQAELVRQINPRRVLCAMDADDAGRKANDRSVERLALTNVRGLAYNWGDHAVNDPGELKEDPWPKMMARARR